MTAGLVDISSRAGIVTPAVVAELPVPAVAGVRFSAMAEVHASADEVDQDTSVVQASDVDRTGRPMESNFGLELLEHLVLDVDLDSQLMKDELGSGPLEHSVPDYAPIGGAVPFIKMSVSDPLEHSGLINSDDVVPKLVPLEPLEHSVPGVPQSQGDGLVSDMDAQVKLRSVCLPRI